LTAAATAPAASILTGFTHTAPASAGTSVEPSVEQIEFSAAGRLQGAHPQSQTRQISTGKIETRAFHMTGLTWSGDTRVVAHLRTRVRGEWSQWFALHPDRHEAEDGTLDAEQARNGTEPLHVPQSDGVEVRLSTSTSIPDDLTIELIDPGVAYVDASGWSPQSGDRPSINSRSDWGADESLRESGNPSYGEVRGAFVHHTAGANGYKKADVPSIIRGIYAYHVKSRGWRDIGYNFVVDKFGRIWEGRYGGISRAVVGAHTYGYNSYAFGTAVLGTYMGNEPTSDTLRAFSELIAWKFGVHGVDPTKVGYPGIKDVPAIAGHRDGGATACPGDKLYSQLSIVRGKVANLLD
jgi:hypothetical protein